MMDDVLANVREHLAALTVTVACHPSQVEALETAAADLEGCPPLHIVGHDAVTPGRAYVMGPGVQQLAIPVEPPTCSLQCVMGSSVLGAGYYGVVAHAHPDCPLHGVPPWAPR